MRGGNARNIRSRKKELEKTLRHGKGRWFDGLKKVFPKKESKKEAVEGKRDQRGQKGARKKEKTVSSFLG